MAEAQDQSQRTEEPTPKRLEEARRKGQVATSREVNHALILAAGALVIAAFVPQAAIGVSQAILPFVAHPHALATDPAGLVQSLGRLLWAVGAALLIPALLLLAAATAGGLVQNGPMFTAQPLAPKLERISPVAGVRRLFSLRSLLEFAKGLVKVMLVAAAAVALVWPSAAQVLEAFRLDAGSLAAMLRDLALRLLIGAAALTAVIALLDLAYQRFEHRKRLRMSRRDLQDEFKQTEGDPFLKARLKALRMERARRRMMAEVPKATVVVTNPTHVAVALRYEPARMRAPVLVAKGADRIALRIREVARAHRVPLVENPPLARALHTAVDLGAEVPSAHYQAVAEVIGFVLRARRH